MSADRAEVRSSAIAPAPVAADVGIVAAMSIEVGFLLDRFRKLRKYSGPRYEVTEGELGGKLVALVLGGMGRTSARAACEVLSTGHRPRSIISAGFGGALDPGLRRLESVFPSEVVDLEGGRFAVDADHAPPQARRGRLLTVNAIVRTAAEKADLRARFGADIVDMETSAVAGFCTQRAIRFLSIRVVSDEAGVDLPKEVLDLMTRSGSYRVGAAVRAIWNRPSSLKDFWNLHEQALQAADRLAEVTEGVVRGLS